MKSARRAFPLRLIGALTLACTLAGCGQKGPLYLPDAATSVVTRPAAATPAPEVTAPDDPDKKKNAAPPVAPVAPAPKP
jgi:predicted small lipoprotein YifL